MKTTATGFHYDSLPDTNAVSRFVAKKYGGADPCRYAGEALRAIQHHCRPAKKDWGLGPLKEFPVIGFDRFEACIIRGKGEFSLYYLHYSRCDDKSASLAICKAILHDWIVETTKAAGAEYVVNKLGEAGIEWENPGEFG